MNFYKILTAVAGVLALLMIAGCSPREEGAAIGGAAGAGAGALVGSAVGHPGAGAVIGGVGGAVAGYEIGKHEEHEDYRHRDYYPDD